MKLIIVTPQFCLLPLQYARPEADNPLNRFGDVNDLIVSPVEGCEKLFLEINSVLKLHRIAVRLSNIKEMHCLDKITFLITTRLLFATATICAPRYALL
ncbi:hypothetical protein Tcan_12340 [Toxocara canis]|uniref:Uncharacterized protein n=1 Tax=Toxocara canis TaxID=6265 RepID=A0A0B2UYE3_TOXCA|nr:hypothetical protein Tcan_12340 [Toxocara canis]